MPTIGTSRCGPNADAEHLVVERLDPETGARLTGYPRINIALPDAAAVMAAAAAAGVTELNVILRVIPDCSGGVNGWRLVLCSEFVPGSLP